MWFWQWRCCGLLWELIPSRRYPERSDFHPRCPRCGHFPVRRWVNNALAISATVNTSPSNEKEDQWHAAQ